MSSKDNGSPSIIPPAPWYFVSDKYAGYSSTVFGKNEEYCDPLKCSVIGDMPHWIQGSFIRMGPGQFKWGTTQVSHALDGDAMAHKFTIHNGHVAYSRKFLMTNYHRKNKKYNQISASGFATWAPPDPCASVFRRFLLYFVPNISTDNANVNLFNIQGKTYVATEVPWMCEIDKSTLDTIKMVACREKLGGQSTSTWLAHPHFDQDGTTWIFNTLPGPFPKFELVKIPPTPSDVPLNNPSVVATLDASTSDIGYYHSFAMTENYFILMPNPMVITSLPQLLTRNICRKSLLDLLKFQPENGNEIHVVERKTGKVLRMCKVSGCLVFHHANAYEKDGHIIMDLTRHPDDTSVRALYMQNCLNDFKGVEYRPGNLVRYRIPLNEVYSDDPEPYHLPVIPSEGNEYEILASGVYAPCINYDRVNGKDYNYVYGMAGFYLEPKITKTNVNTKETIYWTPSPHTVPTLPFFWPNPEGESEDDGVVLTNCTGAKGEESYLVVLDGITLKEICRANMPAHVNWCFHGNFFPDV